MAGQKEEIMKTVFVLLFVVNVVFAQNVMTPSSELHIDCEPDVYIVRCVEQEGVTENVVMYRLSDIDWSKYDRIKFVLSESSETITFIREDLCVE